MTTKIRVDLSQGIIEAEGSEDFVREVYSDFRDRIQARVHPIAEGRPLEVKTTPPAKKPRAKPAKTSQPTPAIVKDLDLTAKGDVPGLREFYQQFNPKTNFERNLIFVYYLKQIRSMPGITVNHVFTCYRDIPDLKVPGALHDSLWDTSRRRGWLDTSSSEDIKLTIAGINYLEHDLRRSQREEAG